MRTGRSKGYSLIELAVIIVVAGAAVVLGSTLYLQQAQQDRNVDHDALMSQASEAILGFIYSRGRLPCPASSASGVENCNITQGHFPYRAVGMAAPPLNSAGLPLVYAHFSRPHANPMRDAALARSLDRYRPYYASRTPAVAAYQEMGSVTGLDFCQALVVAANIEPSQALLNVSSVDGSEFNNVAYVLINPGAGDADGSGSNLDGRNSQMSMANPTAEHPERKADTSYDDRVHAVYFNQLSQQLGCVGVMTPGNAHANALTAASVMQQAMKDYLVQLEFKEFLSYADITGATAGTFAAGADAAIVIAEAATSISSAINTAGGMSGALVAAAAAAVMATAGGIAAAADLAEAIAVAVLADQNVKGFAALQQELDLVHAAIEQNLINSDRAGLYD